MNDDCRNKCAEIIYLYRQKKKVMHNDAQETLFEICKVLEKYSYLDSDWWAEN